MPAMDNLVPTRSSRPARRKAAAERADGPPTSLADALFTTTQQRVLALLYGQPSRSFFASNLIQLTGFCLGAAHRRERRQLVPSPAASSRRKPSVPAGSRGRGRRPR